MSSGLPVEALQPWILGVHALESHLQAEPVGEGTGECGLAGPHHSRDSEDHGRKLEWTINGGRLDDCREQGVGSRSRRRVLLPTPYSLLELMAPLLLHSTGLPNRTMLT